MVVENANDKLAKKKSRYAADANNKEEPYKYSTILP